MDGLTLVSACDCYETECTGNRCPHGTLHGGEAKYGQHLRITTGAIPLVCDVCDHEAEHASA